MRKKQVIKGLNNSQKIRVILDGVGFYMTVGEIVNRFATVRHYEAVEQTLHIMASENCGGVGHRLTMYDNKMNQTSVDVQVDLL